MATNTNNIEDEVRRRAYELWEQYGRPDNGEKEFWLKAEREIKQAKGLNGTPAESSKTTSGSNRQEQTPARKADRVSEIYRVLAAPPALMG